MSTSVPRGDGEAGRSLTDLLDELPALDHATVVHSPSSTLTLAELRDAVSRIAGELERAGVRPGHPVGALVGSGASGVVAMFAVWRAGGVYMPVNHRMTGHEVTQLIGDTPVCLLMGTATDLDGRDPGIGVVELDETTWTARTRRPVPGDAITYDDDIALILRTSGTTGKPKAVLLRHGGTLDALDASLRKLRRRRDTGPREPRAELRVNLIPLSLALWAGIFNTLFSFRAGFGVVLLDRFTPEGFARAVREHGLTSTVLAPAMITMLADAEDIDSLEPLQIVRSITAPLSPAVAQRFHDRYGVLVLNSYGQTELGGEVVGWTIEDIRTFGMAKLGAAGRPYDDVDVRILDENDQELPVGEAGHIHIRSPYRMRGYAAAEDDGADRMLGDYLRTGDVGRLDADGFLWIEGRVSDMINRGGLKVFPDEVEEVLRRHPSVRDAAVAGVPDRRLGEVPYAWIVPADGGVNEAELAAWCREHLAPYKVPISFIAIETMPRNDVGKVLRRELRINVPQREAML